MQHRICDKCSEEIKLSNDEVFNRAERFYTLIKDDATSNQETFWVQFFDGYKALSDPTVFGLGSHHRVSPDTRDMLTKAIALGANAMIVAHNHPRHEVNSLEPSRMDVRFTKKLNSGCRAVGVKLIDHIIIGKGGYYSMEHSGHYRR